jgi:hypothetical protein
VIKAGVAQSLKVLKRVYEKQRTKDVVLAAARRLKDMSCVPEAFQSDKDFFVKLAELNYTVIQTFPEVFRCDADVVLAGLSGFENYNTWYRYDCIRNSYARPNRLVSTTSHEARLLVFLPDSLLQSPDFMQRARQAYRHLDSKLAGYFTTVSTLSLSASEGCT